MSMEKTPALTEQEREIVALDAAAQAAEKEGRGMEALAARRAAVALSAHLERPRLTAVLFARLGDGEMRQGDPQGAVVSFESAFRALGAGGDAGALALLTVFASSSKGIGEPPPMEVNDLYSPEAARTLRAEEEDPALIVELLLRLGNAYLEQPQDDVAMAKYEEALRHPAIEATPLLRAHALSAVALLHRRAGRLGQAEKALGQAVALFDAAAAEPRERRRAWMVRAGIERAQGRTADALATLAEAIRWYSEADEPRGEGRALAALGDLHLAVGRAAEAKAVFERSVGLARGAGDGDTLAVAGIGLGRCLHREGALEAAAAALEEGIASLEQRAGMLRTEEGKVTFLESAGSAHDELVEVRAALAAADPEQAPSVLRAVERARGRALSDLMGAVGRRRPTVPAWASRPPPVMAQMAISVQSGGRRAPVPAPEREVPSLPRIVFHTLEDRTVVLAVAASHRVAVRVVPTGRKAWEERVVRLREALSVAGSMRGVREVRRAGGAAPAEDPRALLRAFFADLIEPVEGMFPEGTKIAIEPHGPLWLLPFAALVRDDGRWLGDLWPFVLSPSNAVLQEIRCEQEPPPPSELPALVVGNPAMPALPAAAGGLVELSPLPGALEEAEAIARKIAPERVVLLTGAEATEARVREVMPRSGIIHLASHGIALTDDPLGSFVVLAAEPGSSGLLTARDVLEVPLDDVFDAPDGRPGAPGERLGGLEPRWESQIAAGVPAGGPGAQMQQQQSLRSMPVAAGGLFPERPPVPPTRSVDLVVLSACQTGLGRVTGDGMIGLSRAFLAAGARTVAVSLWSVSDAATAALMEAFYEGYLRDGDKASALQSAMQSVRARRGWESPRYWAPFVLVGAER